GREQRSATGGGRVAAGRGRPLQKPAVRTPSDGDEWCILAGRAAGLEPFWSGQTYGRGMAWTQLQRSCSPLGGAGSSAKAHPPRGRFDLWRLGGVAGAVLAIGALAAAAASASPVASTLEPSSLARAQAIRAELDARYRVVRGRGLAVTEATATG